jgi:hypothetical protein
MAGRLAGKCAASASAAPRQLPLCPNWPVFTPLLAPLRASLAADNRFTL